MPDLLSDIFPAAFPALALAHFLALLSPGPDFFLILGQAARGRFRGSAFICLGIAAGHAVYVALAVAGWSGLRQYPRLYFVMELAGALYLGWLGFLLLRSGLAGLGKPGGLRGRAGQSGQEQSGPERCPEKAFPGQPARETPVTAKPFWRQLLMGLATALLNPKNAVFYLTLMTVIIGPAATLAQQACAGAWMVLVVLAWDLALAAFFGAGGGRRFIERKIPYVETASGLALLCMAPGVLFFACLFPLT